MGRWGRVLLGALIALAGAVWLLQGVGLLRGSFMTGSAFWAVVGAACLLGGAAIAATGRR